MKQLNRVLTNMSSDLDRVEILSAGLAAFIRPVPDYEPTFHHWRVAALRDHELTTREES